MIAWLLLTAAAAAPLDACAALVDQDPTGRDGYRCLYQAARTTGDYEASIAWLAPVVTAHPDRAWAQLTYGNLLTDQGRIEEGLGHHARARSGFAASGDARGEVFALLNIANWTSSLHQHERALQAVDDAEAVARAAGDPQLVRITEVEAVRTRYRLVERAGETYRRARELLDELTDSDEDYQAKLLVLTVLRTLSQQHDQIAEALQWNARVRQLAEDGGDVYAASVARLNDLKLSMLYPERTRDLHGDDLQALAHAVVEVGRQAGNPFVEGTAACILGELRDGEADQVELLRACVAFADEEAGATDRVFFRLVLADALRARRDLEWRTVLAQAATEAQRLGMPSADLEAARARVAHDEGRHEDAARHAVAALDAWEAHQAALGWTELDVTLADAGNHYYIAAEHLLRIGDHDAALRTVERLRARHLLEQLEGQGALAAAPELVRARELGEALRDAEGALLEGEGTAEEVLSLRGQLAEVWRSARARLAVPEPAGLTELQAALRPGEAALVLQVPIWFGVDAPPDSWGWLVTPDTVEHRSGLPSRAELSARVPLLDGLLAAGEPGTEALAALAEDVLGPFLDALPDDTRHLVLIPDGALHAAPFAALPGPGGEPLAATMTVSMAPSVGVWLHLRSLQAHDPGAALAVADPAGAEPLPASADEVAAIRRVAPEVVVLEGQGATEHAVRAALVADPALVHFAAHGTVDEVFPEQSALTLAGPEPLTAAEVAALDVDGAVVVLAACRSAAGPTRWAEGPIALARAFFQGGARAVVGSLWPLRDDEAAALFSALYDHLGQGLPIGEALALAQRDLASQGAPPRAWAGIVVLGDASARPLPPRPAARWPRALAGGLAAAALGLALTRGGRRV